MYTGVTFLADLLFSTSAVREVAFFLSQKEKGKVTSCFLLPDFFDIIERKKRTCNSCFFWHSSSHFQKLGSSRLSPFRFIPIFLFFVLCLNRASIGRNMRKRHCPPDDDYTHGGSLDTDLIVEDLHKSLECCRSFYFSHLRSCILLPPCM